MLGTKDSISACLVVYNEEMVIERCLKSIAGFVNEIIIVHDGKCTDKTLEIAQKYTDKIFIREHAGMMETHLVFAFNQAKGEWLLRIDADEFLSPEDFPKIKESMLSNETDALILNWEMWNGKKTIYFPGLQKMCFMRRGHFHYCGIPHENGVVDGEVKKINVYLHHRPVYSNVAWTSFWRKSKKWIPVHASYFFPEQTKFECFNDLAEDWIRQARQVRQHLAYYRFGEPFRMSLGQLRNDLWRHNVGWKLGMQRFVYFYWLYSLVTKMEKKLIKA